MKITFVGGGNMATALIGGLVAKGFAPQDMRVVEPLAPNREQLARFAIWMLRRRSGRGRVFAKPWLSWLIEPMVCAVLVVLISTGTLKWLRFGASYPWLYSKASAEIERMRTDGPQEWRDSQDGFQFCGLYRVRSWESGSATDGSPQFLMLTADMTLTDAAGWAYVPSGAKPKNQDRPTMLL